VNFQLVPVAVGGAYNASIWSPFKFWGTTKVPATFPDSEDWCEATISNSSLPISVSTFSLGVNPIPLEKLQADSRFRKELPTVITDSLSNPYFQITRRPHLQWELLPAKLMQRQQLPESWLQFRFFSRWELASLFPQQFAVVVADFCN